MDFTGLLKSIEDLLYELVSWLIFYPITLWRSIRYPVRMFDRALRELASPTDDQFIDTLSPPLFLFLTVVLAHVIDLAATPDHHTFGGIFDDTRNLLLFRAVGFSLFPMILAVQMVRHNRSPLNRNTLRPAFYGHCLIAAPFVLTIDLALTVGSLNSTTTTILGWAIFCAGLIWYQVSLTLWSVQYRGASQASSAIWAARYILLGALAMLLLTALAVAPQIIQAINAEA